MKFFTKAGAYEAASASFNQDLEAGLPHANVPHPSLQTRFVRLYKFVFVVLGVLGTLDSLPKFAKPRIW